MSKKTFKLYIDHPGDFAAGIYPFTDAIEIGVESGAPGGEPGEFEEHLREALTEWYDGAKVQTEAEIEKDIADENKRWGRG